MQLLNKAENIVQMFLAISPFVTMIFKDPFGHPSHFQLLTYWHAPQASLNTIVNFSGLSSQVVFIYIHEEKEYVRHRQGGL